MSGGADLNDIGVLRRREIEARIVAPLLEALGREGIKLAAQTFTKDVAKLSCCAA